MFLKHSIKPVILLLLCAALSVTINAQTPTPRNTPLVLTSPDVNLHGINKAAEAKMNVEIARYKQTDTAIITLPVVFHIINSNPGSITNQQINDALQDLNDAFSKSGAFSGSTGVDTRIRFCLAKTDPDGGITNGITRTTSFFSNNLNPVIEDARLKNLIQWDPTRFINIWYIKTMELEIFPQFNCGKWLRTKAAGYATMPPNAGTLDGIVVTAFKQLLVHEMGHYLGLYHTFEGLDCRNNNCQTDGDKVCDTPPDASLYNVPSCTDIINSCSSDTLSGFGVDVADLTSNFMDYGNASCQNQFTAGQADRMKAAIATQRPGLLEDKCAAPCPENILAGFTRDNAFPLPGNTITFTNTSTGASQYQWLVNDNVVSNTQNFTYSFSSTGKNKVTLKAFNTASCFSTYTDYVIVNCGVTARFYTDKTNIASKAPTYDTVQFINTSENATSYKWMMSSDNGMAEQEVSTAFNFSYVFTSPGNYKVKLIATNGSCTDVTLEHTIYVFDPSPDGAVYISNVECVAQTKVRVNFYVCNSGYVSLPAGLPIHFYDADPRNGNANKLGGTFILPAEIPGNCCGNMYTTTIDVGRRGLNIIYAVFNDSGNTTPLKLPNTYFPEKSYTNNIAIFTNFAFKVTATPATSTLEPGDTLQLNALARPGNISSYLWSSPKNLNCDTCRNPILIADSTTTKRVIATSTLGCTDTAFVEIKVPPYNDYRITIDDVQCSAKDSLRVAFTVFNDFKRALLPSTLSVSFYNGDPLLGGTKLLGPVFFITDTIKAKQASFITSVKGIIKGNVYAVVNDGGTLLPVALPNTVLLEKDYTNNISVKMYVPETVSLQPSDTTVFRKEFVPLKITSTVLNPLSTIWSLPGQSILSCLTCDAPTVQVLDSSIVRVETENRFGCMIKGQASINIFPPDMQVEILDTKCYADNTATITFKVCMNNNYDSVYAGIPIAFFDNNPATGGKLLLPVFTTPQLLPGSCNTYSTQVAAPTTNQIFAVVNNNGTQNVAAAKFAETDINNNTDTATYTPFRIQIIPGDTTIERLTSITLIPQAQGGTLTNYSWKTSPFISCTNCAAPVVTPQYTTQYQLLARNENNCTASAISIVRTNTQGEIFIPDAFTPNNDKLNDVFYVMSGKDAVVLNEFSIFNRWGQLIYSVRNTVPNNPATGWTGKINGKDGASGTYVYMVKIAFGDGTQKMFKGTVVLIR